MISSIAARGSQVGDRDELGPAEQVRGGLCPRRTGEQHPLPESLREMAEPVLDTPVEVPHRGEILQPGHQFVRGDRVRRRAGKEALRVRALHALGPFQVQEVRQRGVAERQERKLHARRKVLGAAREVRPGQAGRRADRGHHVRDQRKVQHLLDGDSGEHLVPARDRAALLSGKALVRPGFQAEARIQVLAHDQVLDLRRLDQQVPQMLAVLDHELRLCHDGLRTARPRTLCEKITQLQFEAAPP